jgi:DNA repair exonuclease SbcCD ATPase subunit
MTKPTKDEMWEALDQLRRSLNAAYWEIADQKEANRILALAQEVDSIQDGIDREEIMGNAVAYKELKQRVKGVNARLNAAKDKIGDVVQKVETVTKVIGQIEKVVKLAAKYFV